MSPEPTRDWQLYCDDILEACGKIRRYLAGMTYDAFVADDRTRDAVIRNIEVIGEAAKPALNALVGRRFRIGSLCEGKRLCETCRYIEGVVAQSLLDPLSHRGGLRADVLEDGEIRIGDELRPVER